MATHVGAYRKALNSGSSVCATRLAVSRRRCTVGGKFLVPQVRDAGGLLAYRSTIQSLICTLRIHDPTPPHADAAAGCAPISRALHDEQVASHVAAYRKALNAG